MLPKTRWFHIWHHSGFFTIFYMIHIKRFFTVKWWGLLENIYMEMIFGEKISLLAIIENGVIHIHDTSWSFEEWHSNFLIIGVIYDSFRCYWCSTYFAHSMALLIQKSIFAKFISPLTRSVLRCPRNWNVRLWPEFSVVTPMVFFSPTIRFLAGHSFFVWLRNDVSSSSRG